MCDTRDKEFLKHKWSQGNSDSFHGENSIRANMKDKKKNEENFTRYRRRIYYSTSMLLNLSTTDILDK